MALLVSSNIFLHITSAQNNERLKEKTETLLNVVNEVNVSIKTIFNEITMEGFDIPVKAERSYLDGCLLANQSFTLYRNGSYSQASTIAVESLKKLKDAAIIASQVMPYEPDPFEDATLKILVLNASIVQAHDYLSRLENSFNKTTVTDDNSSAFRASIKDAKEHLTTAKAKLNLMEINNTEEQLALAKASLSKAVMHMNALTVAVKALKTEQYIVVAEERLTLLRANLTAASVNMSQQVRNASLTALNIAESRLQTAKDFLANDMVDETVEELEESKKYERLAVTYLESASDILDEHDVEKLDTCN